MGAVAVLAGGVPHAHDFPAIGASIVELVRRTDGDVHSVDLVDHPDHLVELLADRTDVLVVDALFWRMVGDAYDPWRQEWAYSPPQSTRVAIADFVGNGGGLVALHTASICFDDWPEWGDIVGGSWKWGVSSHPPVGPVEARVVAEHPVTAGAGEGFHLRDEVYGELWVRPQVEVLAVAKRTAEDADQPVLWAHQYGRGRVVYNGFGHDAASVVHPVNAQILTRAISWVRGET
jgi:hypothetical protein